MKFILFFVAVFSYICASAGFEMIKPPNPEHPGVCIFEGKELKPGTNNLPDKCLRLACGTDGSIHISGCGITLMEGCTKGDLVDVSKDYPECCKRKFHCKDENNLEFIREM